MARRHQGLLWTQRTGPAPPGPRPTHVEETNPYSGYSQRAISVRDIMNHENIYASSFTIFIAQLPIANSEYF